MSVVASNQLFNERLDIGILPIVICWLSSGPLVAC